MQQRAFAQARQHLAGPRHGAQDRACRQQALERALIGGLDGRVARQPREVPAHRGIALGRRAPVQVHGLTARGRDGLGKRRQAQVDDL
jgi:hypothetical protein